MEDYLKLTVQCSEELSDILIAELDLIDYEGFIYEEIGFSASIKKSLYNEQTFQEVIKNYHGMGSIKTELTQVENKNWNEEWEKSFQPITIGSKCIVRASFHEKTDLPYEIIIDPKMAFGTGHHATTYLMLEQMMGLDVENKNVLDAGCGTGILAIMAEKLHAKQIDAYDIDPIATENAIENLSLNEVNKIEILTGTFEEVRDHLRPPYDMILANITKDVLRIDVPKYTELLTKNGLLIVSGFYTDDIPQVVEMGVKSYLRPLSETYKSDWASIVFKNNAGL